MGTQTPYCTFKSQEVHISWANTQAVQHKFNIWTLQWAVQQLIWLICWLIRACDVCSYIFWLTVKAVLSYVSTQSMTYIMHLLCLSCQSLVFANGPRNGHQTCLYKRITFLATTISHKSYRNPRLAKSIKITVRKWKKCLTDLGA